jgi:hypothetical protein
MLQRRWAEAFVLGLLPVLVWIAFPIQLFPPPGWIDPSLYLGYFFNFPLLLQRFGADYHGMRLPWVLTGFAAHWVFSTRPTLAQLSLLFGFHGLAATSLYLIVAPRYGRSAGLLSTLFLTLNPAWIAAVTRGYVDGPAIAFQFATVAIIMNVEQFHTAWVPGLLAGVFGSLAFHTHPVVGVFTGAAYVASLASQRTRWRAIVQLTLWVLAGFVASTVALGLVSRHFGGPFLFPLVSFGFGKRALGGFGLAYRWPVGVWLPSAYMLFPPLALLLCGLGALAWPPGTSRPTTVLEVGCAVLGFSVLALVIWDVAIGGSYLQSSFAVTFLLFGQALVFAGLLAMVLERSGHQWRGVNLTISASLFGVGLLPLATVRTLWSAEQALRGLFVVWLVLAAIAVCAAAALRTRRALATPVLLLFATSVSGVLNVDTRRIFRVDGNRNYRAFYRAAHRVNAFIRGNLETDRPLLLWYNRDDFTTGDAGLDEWMRYRMRFQGQPLVLSVYDSFASLWLWYRAALNFAMPAIGAEDVARLNALLPATLVMFCPELARCNGGLKELERNGYSVHFRAMTRIAEPTYIDVTLVAVDAKRAR